MSDTLSTSPAANSEPQENARSTLPNIAGKSDRLSSAQDTDGDDGNPTHRSSIWTADATSDTPPTPPQEAHNDASQQDRVFRPSDPYAHPVHIPSGRPLATWAKRFAAYLIDGVVFGAAVVYLEFWIQGLALNAIVYEALDWALAVYYVLLIGGYRGQTPGMRAMKIAVRDIDTGKTVGYRNAVKRTFVMWIGSIPVGLGLIVDCLFPLWDKSQQALHDRFANTVVIDVSTPQMVEVPAPGLAGDAAGEPANGEPANGKSANGKSANGEPANGKPPRKKPSWPKSAAALLARWVPRSRKFWITAAASLVAIAVVVAAVTAAARLNADRHSPDVAAIAYLKARATRNVTAMLDNATIVTPPPSSQKASFLFTPRDIATVIDAPGNPTEAVSNVKVLATTVSPTGNSARVILDYVAGGGDKETTFSLVADNRIPSGWTVQVIPAELDVELPQGATEATIDGITVPVDGQAAQVWLFPAVAEVATPASPVYQAQSARVDLTQPEPSAAPTKVTLPATLTGQATTSAQAVAAGQITNCLAATSLRPANCPNADIPATTSQGDTYTNIAWTSLGDPTAGLTVTLDPTGTVTVAGSMSAEVTYTDTTPGSSFFGSVSQVQTDGPTNVWFSYPITWNGTGWTLGTVTASNQPPAGQSTSSAA